MTHIEQAIKYVGKKTAGRFPRRHVPALIRS
jgi:hypothetical protein